MSRPKPTVKLKITDEKTRQTTEILKAKGVFTVLFDGEPFNVRRKSAPNQEKYLRTSFPDKGYAIAMARRLNELTDTDRFSVAVMETGQAVAIPAK